MELKEVDQKKVNNVMFKRIGVDVPMLSESSEDFESDHLPARALVLSNRFGYVFFAHSQGFSVAKTADLLVVAERLSADADTDGINTAEEAGAATIAVSQIRSLALSSDELTVCVCAGGEVMFYELATIIHKSAKRPFEVRKVDPEGDIYAKDFLWSPSESEAYCILTSQGKLSVGHIGSAPECKVDKGVIAASWSADGQHIAYVTDGRQLSITTSNLNFAKTIQHELPSCLSDDDDVSADLHGSPRAYLLGTVDAIRWVRPDSIVIGYLQVDSEEEDECPLFVLTSRNGNLAKEDSNLLGLVFYQLFPSIDPFVIPSGSGPYMLSDYVKPWELMVAASRRSIDDHIVLMGWFPEDGRDVLYSLELGNDVWTPRIELQESSEDNAILGLAIDCTTVQIKLSDPTDESGDTMLPPCPVLVCLTLEGKLSFFSVARLGEASQVPGLVTSPLNVPDAKRSIPKPSAQQSKQDTASTLVASSPPMVNVDPPKVEPPKIEPPKIETPKIEPPKVEPPKTEPPKVEPPKAEQHKEGLPSSELTTKTREDGKEPIDQSPFMIRTQPAAKEERDSLFERFTSASPSFSQGALGDHPSGSSRSGLTLFSDQAKKTTSISTSPSVPELRGFSSAVNVASTIQTFEGLFRPFEDASKSGLASVKSAPPQVQWGSQLPSVSSLPVTSSMPLQSVQSGPVPTHVRAGSQGKGFHGGPSSNPLISFGQGSQGKGFQGGPAASATVSFGPGSQGKGFQGGPAANATVSFGPGSQGKSFQGMPTANPAISVGQGSQGKGFQGAPAANPAISVGQGSQGKGAQRESATNQSVFPGPSSQGKGFQGGPVATQTAPVGGSVKSPLGPAAPRVTSSQRAVERVTHSSRVLQGHQAAVRAAGVTDMEAAFNAELEQVREMLEKVDQLMAYIEGRWQGDAQETPVVFTKQSLEDLEQGIQRLSTECKELSGQLNKNKDAIEDLRDEEMRVDAWRIYTQSLMDQKNDSRYQELWNSQKLHPELEITRKRLLKADQELKQHIAELEGHLHILELKQFQQANTRGRTNKAVQTPGRFLSVQNLYNTVNAQMAVADELSNVLAQQMEALNIKWSPQTPKSTSSRILKSVGADTDGPEYLQSPLLRTRLSYSPMPQRGSTNGFPTQDKEPSIQDTTRRRRDSIDAAWVKRETPKTTIKRVVRTRSDQAVPPNDSNVPPFRHRLQTSPGVSATEKSHFSKNAQAAQSMRMAFPSAEQSLSDPSFETSVPPFRPTGMFASTPQWPSSRPEAQQTRPGLTFPSGDLIGSTSATAQGSAGQDITYSAKDSMFKRANPMSMSKPITSAPPSTVLPATTAKPFSRDSGEGTVAGMANSRFLQAAKPATFSTSGGTGAFNFAQASLSNSTTASNTDSTAGFFQGTSQGLSPSEMGTRMGHRLGALSSGEIDADRTGEQTGNANEMHNTGSPNKPTSVHSAPGPVPILTGSSPAPRFGGRLSPSVMGGPISFSQNFKPTIEAEPSKGATSTGIAPSFQTARIKEVEREPRKREEESKPTKSKEAPFSSFSISTVSAFTASTTSAPTQSSGSAFSNSVTSVPSQSSGSLFASSSVPEFPTSSPQSVPSSPFKPTIGTESSKGATSTGIAPSFQTARSKESEKEPRKREEESKPNNSKEAPFSSFSTSTVSAFTASTTSAPPQPSGSAFSNSVTSVPNQSSGSLFASSSVPEFPTSSPQSAPSSPFGQQPAFGQSTFGQSSPFGQSPQQQPAPPFTFPGSSASSVVSNAASVAPIESNEEDMEEEASTGIGNTGLGSFGGFGGLGLGSSATEAQTPKANPFGSASFGNTPSFQLTPPSGGQLFRPATFSLPAAQSSPQQAGGSTFGSGFGSSGFSQNNLFSDAGKGFGSPPQQSSGGGFGQPAQLGPGQQALGSALGAFGQTRQVGFGTPFGNSGMGSSPGGGFGNATPGGGFANAATGGGFASAATGGGFAKAATGGGFAGAAMGGGFAGAASGGGFNTGGGAGGGFGGLAGGGGFQAFAGGNQVASPGFGSGVPPAQTNLFTQIRK